ncbi:MAG: hypothetical protein FWG93_04460 [Oscillospiraceae bacterium]|nr:hypothetical protein [Oscillospiraceae bacterium]
MTKAEKLKIEELESKIRFYGEQYVASINTAEQKAEEARNQIYGIFGPAFSKMANEEYSKTHNFWIKYANKYGKKIDSLRMELEMLQKLDPD